MRRDLENARKALALSIFILKKLALNFSRCKSEHKNIPKAMTYMNSGRLEESPKSITIQSVKPFDVSLLNINLIQDECAVGRYIKSPPSVFPL